MAPYFDKVMNALNKYLSGNRSGRLATGPGDEADLMDIAGALSNPTGQEIFFKDAHPDLKTAMDFYRAH